jgi:hypothetical protein
MDDRAEGPEDGTPDGAEEGLRERVEEKYDFEEFGPEDMAEMSAEEWEVAFDPDSWVTGTELLDRVEADLEARIARRDVFAVVEREHGPEGERLVAYSDEGYAVVYADGGVEGRGTVVRDVKPSVALCSMPDYEVLDAPEDTELPAPESVSQGSGDLGNRIIQVVGLIQVLAGVALVVAPFVVDPLLRALCSRAGDAYACSIGGVTTRVHPLGESLLIAIVAGLAFLGFGAFLLVVVANARLSDRFRAEEYRERLRDSGVESGERPAFVPGPDEPAVGEEGPAGQVDPADAETTGSERGSDPDSTDRDRG